MALLKCEDCGHDVSSRAEACPHCGCPVPKDESPPTPPPVPPPAQALPAAWTEREAAPVPPPASSAPQPKSTSTAFKVSALLLAGFVLLILVRGCAGTSPSSNPSNTATPAAEAPTTSPSSYAPTEQQKQRWWEIAQDKDQGASTRLSSAQSLIANFPETPEGKQAQQLIPELEKAAAYDAMGQQWRYDRSDEGMSGKAVISAQVTSTNTINLDFPYSGSQHGTLTLRRHPRWGNDVIFRIERGQILCHSYGDCTINVKFDDGKVIRLNGNPPEDNSSEVVFIPGFSTFTKQLPNAKRVKIEVSLYQAGNQVFEFDVSGFKPENFK